jgi:hypothetical protein
MTDNPSFWGLLAVILTPGGIGFLWLVKKARLSPDAAVAVARPEGPLPSNHNEALISLALQLEELRTDLTNHKVYVPQLVGWGRRGWSHAPAEQREPLPEPPRGIAI